MSKVLSPAEAAAARIKFEELKKLAEQRQLVDLELINKLAKALEKVKAVPAGVVSSLPAAGAGSKQQATVKRSLQPVAAPDPKRLRLDSDTDRKIQDPLWRACANVLEYLTKKKIATVFMKPVDPVRDGVPDYHKFITHPMDLGTVKTKLKERKYADPREYVADIRLIWFNCRSYNQAGTLVRQWGDQMSDDFERKWAEQNIEQRWDELMVQRDPQAVALDQRIASSARQLVQRVNSIHMLPDADPTRPMTAVEKRKLSIALSDLQGDQLSEVVNIIAHSLQDVSPEEDGEIELDVDQLDNPTLWRLRDFCDGISSRHTVKALPPAKGGAGQRGGAAADGGRQQTASKAPARTESGSESDRYSAEQDVKGSNMVEQPQSNGGWLGGAPRKQQPAGGAGDGAGALDQGAVAAGAGEAEDPQGLEAAEGAEAEADVAEGAEAEAEAAEGPEAAGDAEAEAEAAEGAEAEAEAAEGAEAEAEAAEGAEAEAEAAEGAEAEAEAAEGAEAEAEAAEGAEAEAEAAEGAEAEAEAAEGLATAEGVEAEAEAAEDAEAEPEAAEGAEAEPEAAEAEAAQGDGAASEGAEAAAAATAEPNDEVAEATKAGPAAEAAPDADMGVVEAVATADDAAVEVEAGAAAGTGEAAGGQESEWDAAAAKPDTAMEEGASAEGDVEMEDQQPAPLAAAEGDGGGDEGGEAVEGQSNFVKNQRTALPVDESATAPKDKSAIATDKKSNKDVVLNASAWQTADEDGAEGGGEEAGAGGCGGGEEGDDLWDSFRSVAEREKQQKADEEKRRKELEQERERERLRAVAEARHAKESEERKMREAEEAEAAEAKRAKDEARQKEMEELQMQANTAQVYQPPDANAFAQTFGAGGTDINDLGLMYKHNDDADDVNFDD
ncbi:Transcription factor GTE3, chloroplastic [Tetrabaena socialis]|uniref:Transcription factor GTE3, chloroplastic n=1 Tax=Tetrabaena socialis TaxID=47790 RepID=A0A2J7ZWL5_9CHLO|nr:Transcription factor GTE3, chloroplastic [Tetrabaena socialis]|eukprot:PNH04654.1 Transcription factor GTE3, chloroplastic [Tetrabaena socialis]